jgi:hypothetical protein
MEAPMKKPSEWYDELLKDNRPPEVVIANIQQEAYVAGIEYVMKYVKGFCEKQTKYLMNYDNPNKPTTGRE